VAGAVALLDRRRPVKVKKRFSGKLSSSLERRGGHFFLLSKEDVQIPSTYVLSISLLRLLKL